MGFNKFKTGVDSVKELSFCSTLIKSGKCLKLPCILIVSAVVFLINLLPGYSFGQGAKIPSPEIRINSSDAPDSIAEGEAFIVSATLDPGDNEGDKADWWLAYTDGEDF